MNKQTFRLNLLCACLAIAFFFLLWNWEGVTAGLGKIFRVLRPVMVGGAMAFVLNIPLVRIRRLYAKSRALAAAPRLADALSIVTVYLAFFAAVTGIVVFVLPQLAGSVELFAANFDGYYRNMMVWIDRVSVALGPDFWTEWNIADLDFMGWIEDLYKQLPTLLQGALGGVVGAVSGFVGGVMDTFLGFLISIYLLADKRRMTLRGKAIIQAFLPRQWSECLLRLLNLIYQTFSAFIGGQCTEAVILGVLCFVGMNIFGFGYAPLISVIIAITNLVPIVGPILGTIPCAFILLLVDPMDAVWFVVFIIVLQQLESNLIYPRVVGTSVGLPAFWVLFSVIVGGGMFGVMGMILGIPAVSIIYRLVHTASDPYLEDEARQQPQVPDNEGEGGECP